MKKLILAFLLVAPIVKAQHKLWDNKPAKDWMTEAYPIGNGRMGGMVFGGVKQEHIQFNEQSLWAGDENETGSYQAFGDLYIDFFNQSDSVNYRRALNIGQSIHEISYESQGVHFKREYFCSFPNKVMVLHFTADRKKAYSVLIHVTDAHGAATKGLRITGSLPNGMLYDANAIVIPDHGSCTQEKSGMRVNADGFTVILCAATNFINKRELHWHGQDAKIKVDRYLQLAKSKNYAALKAAHISDYTALFNRVSLHLAKPDDRLTTKEQILDYKNTGNAAIEALMFEYGRYLLISSSRKGGLPANLQGLWNNSNDPIWRSDYHSNINVEMNYWAAEPANLSECHIPFLEYINSIREVKKESTRKDFPNTRGWTVKTENNIFGGSSFIWNTPGSAWYAQHIWEHYAFNGDKNYLRRFAYPILKEIVEFWDDQLKRRPDGTLVSPMGWSPEHGPQEDGVSYDQEIVDDLFTNYIAASKTLDTDRAYRAHVADMKAHLLQPKIGSWGQLQEWESDRDDPKDHHRHVSQLFALYPGKSINNAIPELLKAARVSLLARGDSSTGWSMAWKMNFWARLQDGEHAHAILNNFITLAGGSAVNYNDGGGVYPNLLCAHPPFQIDGNLGYTAGICEMLVQSQANEIDLLPALPKVWPDGEVKGLKARGNFTITDLQWQEGKVIKLVVASGSGNECRLQFNGQTRSFRTQMGKSYTILDHRTPPAYYIDPVHGNDRNSGDTKMKPWKTFRVINHSALTAGSILHIYPGDFHQSLMVKANGTPAAPVKILFGPGIYNFFPDRAQKLSLQISNTNDKPNELKAIALIFDSCRYVEVTGKRSKLVMRGKMVETYINASSRINLTGLSYDYKRPTVSELKVINTTATYADLQIHKDSHYMVSDSTLKWIGEGWSCPPTALWQELNPITNKVNRVELSPAGIRYADLGGNQLRAYFASNPGFKKGFIYQSRDITRDCAGIFIQRSDNIALNHLNIYFMHGMGVVSQLSENLHFEHVSVRPAAGTGRTCAAWADILHFSGCKGKIEIAHSYLSAANDDAINVHGVFLKIIKTGTQAITVRFMHDQTFGFANYVPGDSIDFVKTATLLPYASNKVTLVEKLNDREYQLTLQDPLPQGLVLGDVIENATATPEVYIHDDTITRIPTRGILVTSRRKVIIENNLFLRTHMNAITVGDDAAYWYESGMVRDLTVQGNQFLQCGEPVIDILPQNQVCQGPVHQNIKITGNKFQLRGTALLAARCSANILLRDNEISTPVKNVKIADLVDFDNCSGVQFSNNPIKSIP